MSISDATLFAGLLLPTAEALVAGRVPVGRAGVATSDAVDELE